MGRIYKNGINYSGGVVPNSNSGFYSNNVYLSNTASDVSTYKILSYVSDSVEIEKSLTINSSQGEQLCEVYLYPTSIGISTIDSGMWTTNFTTKISSTAGGSTTMRFECFVRHIDNSETVLFTETSIPITSVAYASLISEVSRQVYTVTTTDRLGFKVYVTTTRSQDTTLSYIIGNGRASLFTMPLPLRHSQLRNKNEEANYQHITTAEKTALQSPTFTEASTLANIVSGESNTTLWGKVMKFIGFIGTGVGNVAPVYSASMTYGVGAFVIYNNKLYRCNTKITVAESFNVSKWTAISFTDMMSVITYPEIESYNATYFSGIGSSGIIKCGKTITLLTVICPTVSVPNGATIFTLPVGCRPPAQVVFCVRCLNDPAIAKLLAVNSNGTVVYMDNNGNAPIGCWLDGGISFPTNQ